MQETWIRSLNWDDPLEEGWQPAGVLPRLIQGIRSGTASATYLFKYFIKDIKSNRMRIAQ